MQNQKILIIGGTGALGKTLINRYYKNNELFILSRDEHKQVNLIKQYRNVIVASYNINKCEEYLFRKRIERWLQQLRYFILNGRYDIQTVDGHYKIFLKDNQKILNKRIMK